MTGPPTRPESFDQKAITIGRRRQTSTKTSNKLISDGRVSRTQLSTEPGSTWPRCGCLDSCLQRPNVAMPSLGCAQPQLQSAPSHRCGRNSTRSSALPVPTSSNHGAPPQLARFSEARITGVRNRPGGASSAMVPSAIGSTPPPRRSTCTSPDKGSINPRLLIRPVRAHWSGILSAPTTPPGN